MKVIAINGSPHTNGNTGIALQTIGEELKKANIEFEIIHIGNKKIQGCIACGKCAVNRDERCVIPDNTINHAIAKMKEADGILLGSPVYYAGIAGTMKSFLDRAFYVAGSNNGLFRHKIGASVVAARRAGGSVTFDNLNHYLTISEMHVASANYWNIIHGASPGEALKDKEGLQIMRVLGRNMAWLLKIRKETAGKIPLPVIEEKKWTNFIRDYN